jgi:hypothetical protein
LSAELFCPIEHGVKLQRADCIAVNSIAEIQCFQG